MVAVGEAGTGDDVRVGVGGTVEVMVGVMVGVMVEVGVAVAVGVAVGTWLIRLIYFFA